MILRSVIIDDENHCVETLETMLRKYTSVRNLASFTKPEKAIRDIDAIDTDILFLDIEMPHLNGFELLSLFPNASWNVVFTTAYDEYAVKAFKYNAIDYLLKPIAKSDLVACVERIETKLATAKMKPIQDYLNHFQQQIRKLAIPTFSGFELLPLSEIEYLQSDSNYTHIYRSNGEKMLASKTLKYFEARVPSTTYIRVHHSFIVNLEAVVRYIKGDGGSVVLRSGVEIPVSRPRKEELLRHLS